MNLDRLEDTAKKYAGWPEKLPVIGVDKGTAYAGDINSLELVPLALYKLLR